ncbi:MAG TPA: hypothetical protein VL899_10755 [Alphaproteobacteria bacterium]|jgi:hypothetical protein|nr:hypothetical protein [Alphaproteobacteria bacterium]
MSVLKKASFGAVLLAATAVLGGCYYGPAYPRYAYGRPYYRPAYVPPPVYGPYGGVVVSGGYRRW